MQTWDAIRSRRNVRVYTPEPVMDRYDLGQATYAMTLAAADLGLGTGHSAVGDADRARAVLGVPDGYQVCYLLGIGYPADRPPRPVRRPGRRLFGEVVHRGTQAVPADQAIESGTAAS